MQFTQLSAVIISLGVAAALAVLTIVLRRRRVRHLDREILQERYRRDVRAVRQRTIRVAGRRSDDVWSAGAAPDSPQSKGKKAVAYLAVGSVSGGCGGCGGCGCGG